MRLLVLSVVMSCALFASAHADCVEGTSPKVDAISNVLAERGVACTATATITDNGDRLAIHIVLPDGSAVDRVADDADTAATVIESFARIDIGNALLATRPAPRVAVGPSPEVVRDAAPPKPAPENKRGIQLFGAFESSYADDHTSWLGAHVGACVMLGPVCGAARLRFASVVHGSDAWDDLERRGIELLVGVDIPFAVGGVSVAPGFAAGLGQMHTRGATRQMRAETGGPCADAHLTLSFPLWGHFALDAFAAADLTQETHIESEMIALPPEPRLLLRIGAGLRYEGL